MSSLLLIILLLVVSFVYAGVGLGGGTAYLALLSFWTTDPDFIRPVAWFLNILAAGLGFINYWKAGHFDVKLAMYFLVPGIAGAAAGAQLHINHTMFSFILAVCLFCVAVTMIRPPGKKKPGSDEIVSRPSLSLVSVTSFLIGGISGIVGIGGGIILGPIMVSLKWAKMKQVASITSIYVCLLSASALISYMFTGHNFDAVFALKSGGIVILGAFLGSWYGAFKASPGLVKRVFGIVVLVAALRIFWKMVI